MFWQHPSSLAIHLSVLSRVHLAVNILSAFRPQALFCFQALSCHSPRFARFGRFTTSSVAVTVDQVGIYGKKNVGEWGRSLQIISAYVVYV